MMKMPFLALFSAFLPLFLGACTTVHVSLIPEAKTRAKNSHLLSGISTSALSPVPNPHSPWYNAAVKKAFLLAKAQGFKDSSDLIIRKQGKMILNPEAFNVVEMTSDLIIKGLPRHSGDPGVGVPVLLWAAKDSPFLAGQPGIPNAGVALPSTLVLRQERGIPVLEFLDTMNTSEVVIYGEHLPLASDYSAPLAYCISKGQNRTLDLKALFHTKQSLINVGLLQIQKYDPNKVPVIFVHGLLCRPEAWTAATNELLSDPAVRKNYQFWYFRYPTGLPVWASAALLRSEMGRFQKQLDPQNQNPKMRRIILVGHSMGGLISDLMIRRGGSNLWSQFATKPMEQLAVKPATKKHMKDLIDFEPRTDVARVVFVATPHRGSPLALKQWASFFAGFIKLPYIPLNSDMTTIRQALRSEMRQLFSAPVNGILCLKAQSPILLSILKLPRSEKVPYHSIIGDQGKHNSPNSSDGIVPYWSSHVEGAVSEKVVSSGHGANENSEGIKEIDRILVSALKE